MPSVYPILVDYYPILLPNSSLLSLLWVPSRQRTYPYQLIIIIIIIIISGIIIIIIMNMLLFVCY